MQVTIKNETGNSVDTSIINKNGVDIMKQLSVGEIDIKFEAGNINKAIITATMVNTNIKADGTVLLDFSELSDDNLLYVWDELEDVMRGKGLLK